MREFDQSQSWLDNSGKPLIGRLTFYKLHTSEKATIYNVNGTAIANPQFTNTIGQTVNQVFLDNDIDYTVSYEKYIGNGIMVDDEEPSNWEFQYSNDCTAIKVILEIDTDSLQSVNVISDLRNLDPNTVATRGNGKYIELLGYNETLDKPIVYYKWNTTSIAADNGGSIIKVNDISTGRWELVNLFDNNGVDVRHFGVFGAASRSAATDNMSNMIYAASQYASSIGKNLYFPAIPGLGISWYKMNNLTINGAIFENTTKVFGNTGTSTTIKVVGETNGLSVYSDNDYKPSWTLQGEIVRTSYTTTTTNMTFSPSYKFIIDSNLDLNNITISNVIVDFVSENNSGAGYTTFNNCTINSNKKIAEKIIVSGNTKLTESMFKTTTPVVLFSNYTGVIDIDDFPTTSLWVDFVSSLDPSIVDFKNREVDSTCQFEWGSGNTKTITYKNAKFNNYVIDSKFTTFENCTGTFSLSHVGGINEYTLKYSQLQQTNNLTFSKLYCYNSTFTYNYTSTPSKVYTEDSKLYCGTITCSDIECYDTLVNGALSGRVHLERCDLKGAITDNVNPVIIGCIVRNSINQASTAANIQFTIVNNTFMDSGKHNLSSTVASSYLSNAKWVGNNNLTSSHFISLNRSNLKSSENDHTYEYENNTGKYTLQRLAAKWRDNITAGGGTAAKTIGYISFGGGGHYYYSGTYNDPSYYLTSCEFFSVGTTAVNCLFGGCASDVSSGTPHSVYINFIPVSQASVAPDPDSTYWRDGVPAQLQFQSGYTWKICNAFGFMMDLDIYPAYTSGIIIMYFELKPRKIY